MAFRQVWSLGGESLTLEQEITLRQMMGGNTEPIGSVEIPSKITFGLPELVASIGQQGYELARSPLTASENLLSAIGSGDRWAPGLALLDYLANVPGPTESILAKLGPLTMKGVNALRDVMSPGTYVSPKAALRVGIPEVAEGIPAGTFSSLYDRTPMVEIPDDAARLLQSPADFQTIALKDVLSNLETYNAYKDLPEIPVVGADVIGERASYVRNAMGNDPDSIGAMTINLSMVSDRTTNDILHEIQHAIQDREGWARGGSPEAASLIPDIVEKRINLNRKLTQMSKDGKYGTVEYDTLKAERDRLIQKEWELENPNNPEVAYRMYQNLLGEIQARDTATRMNLNALQRTVDQPLHPLAGQGGLAPDARWSPLNTENIPIEDAIVRMQNQGNPLSATIPSETNALKQVLGEGGEAVAKKMGGPEELKWLSDLASGSDDIYIRWSGGPKIDSKQKYSIDKVSMTPEPGLSSVKLDESWLNPDQGGLWYFIKRLTDYAYGTKLSNRNVSGWLYKGNKLGVDSDGHPAIEITDTVGKVSKQLWKDIDSGLSDYLLQKQNQLYYLDRSSKSSGEARKRFLEYVNSANEKLSAFPDRFRKYDSLISKEVSQKISNYEAYSSGGNK